MESKEIYILRIKDRDNNIIDTKMLKESEIKKIYLTEKKNMRSKWYIIQTNMPIYSWFRSEVSRTLDAWYIVNYYYIKWSKHRPLVHNKKNLAKYFYTLVKI